MKRNWLSYMCMAALLSGALTSCNESSFLNLSDPNHFTESNFWKDKADAESALAAAYSPHKRSHVRILRCIRRLAEPQRSRR